MLIVNEPLPDIMTAAESLEILNWHRASAVAACLDRPIDWKVCEGCTRLVAVQRPFCPFCHAYRFDTCPEVIHEAAKRDMARERPLCLPRWVAPSQENPQT